MGEPVSWLLIERGWEVVDSAGERVGTIREVVGDWDHDIFDGLRLEGYARYVPAERVAHIEERRIELGVDLATLEGDPVREPRGTVLRRDRGAEL
jgi:hypothetical protein